MQPYFFPYIGYFQLMAAADVFVVHDDVQYIKGGWINRNRILVNGGPRWIVLPVEADVHSRYINERDYAPKRVAFRKVARQIEAAYRKAPQFESFFPVIETVLAFEDRNVAAFNLNLLQIVASHVGLQPTFVVSSTMSKDEALRGEQRVIAMCASLGASRYINSIGGAELYRHSSFASSGIDLAFLRPDPRAYTHFSPTHVPALSIIDVLMFNDADTVRGMLSECDVVESISGVPGRRTDA